MPHPIDVIPLLYVPRPHRGVFSYASPAPLPRGAIVQVTLGRRATLGIVVGDSKKKPSYPLKPVSRILADFAFIPETLMRFLEWEAKATVTSPGIVFDRAIPAWIRNGEWRIANGEWHDDRAGGQGPKASRAPKTAFLYRDDAQRFREYRKIVQWSLRQNAQALVLAPTLAARAALIETLRHPACAAAPKGKTRAAKDLWLRIRSGEPLCIVGGTSALRLPFKNLGAVILEDETNTLWKETREHPLTNGRAAAEALAALHGARSVYGGILPSLETYTRLSPKGRKSIGQMNSRGHALFVDLRDDRPRDGLSRTLTTAAQACLENRKEARMFFFVNRRGTAPALTCADCGFVFSCTECDAPMPLFALNADIRGQQRGHTRTAIGPHLNGPRKSANTDGQRTSAFSPRESASAAELRCRHCGRTFIPPLVCPSCRGLRLVPRGVAGEKIEGALLRDFPSLWVSRLDADTARTQKRQNDILSAFRSTKGPAALVGTSKALSVSLPLLDIIAIPAFDHFLAVPDFRTEEETFAQVLRLRKLLKPAGALIVQSWHSESPTLEAIASGNFHGFAKRELALRREFGWPPYRRIAKLTFRHRNPEGASSEAQRLSRSLARSLSRSLARELEGPYPAFIPRMRGKYVWHILVKWPPRRPTRTGTRTDADNLRTEKVLWREVPAKWDVDVDPTSIL